MKIFHLVVGKRLKLETVRALLWVSEILYISKLSIDEENKNFMSIAAELLRNLLVRKTFFEALNDKKAHIYEKYH